MSEPKLDKETLEVLSKFLPQEHKAQTEYELFADGDLVGETFERLSPTVGRGQRVHKILIKSAKSICSAKRKKDYCDLNKFDESEISEDYSDSESLMMLLNEIAKDFKDGGVENLNRKEAVGMVNDFLLDWNGTL